MSNQHHSGSGMDMAVVRNIDHEFFTYFALNPPMKDRNQSFQFHGLGILEIEFDVDMLQFHVPFLAALANSGLSPKITAGGPRPS